VGHLEGLRIFDRTGVLGTRLGCGGLLLWFPLECRTSRFTDWRPRHAVCQVRASAGAAIGELIGANLCTLMETPNISQTPLVRRYGTRGAKLFARLWFPLLYAMLIALNATFWIVGPEFRPGWRRTLFGSVVGTLTVVAASLLTRMRLQYMAAIERLETRGKAA